MARIKLHDSTQSAVVKMADGNPGALTVMIGLLKITPEVDPTNMLGGFGFVLLLDTFEIYGERIWMLYKDFCQEDIEKTIFVLRACQMGIMSLRELNFAIDNYGADLNCPSESRAGSKFPLEGIISLTQDALN